MTPSKEAIEAVVVEEMMMKEFVFAGRDLNSAVRQILKAAYAIDVAPLEKEIAELKSDCDESDIIQAHSRQIAALQQQLSDCIASHQKQNAYVDKLEGELEQLNREQIDRLQAEVEREKRRGDFGDIIRTQIMGALGPEYHQLPLVDGIHRLKQQLTDQRAAMDGLVAALRSLLKNYHLAYEDREQANAALATVEKVRES